MIRLHSTRFLGQRRPRMMPQRVASSRRRRPISSVGSARAARSSGRSVGRRSIMCFDCLLGTVSATSTHTHTIHDGRRGSICRLQPSCAAQPASRGATRANAGPGAAAAVLFFSVEFAVLAAAAAGQVQSEGRLQGCLDVRTRRTWGESKAQGVAGGGGGVTEGSRAGG